MRRTDRHDIAMAILKAAKLPVHKPQLMYKAGLSYTQLKRYLTLMIKSGLVENHRTEKNGRVETLYETMYACIRFLKNLELAEKPWRSDKQASAESFSFP